MSEANQDGQKKNNRLELPDLAFILTFAVAADAVSLIPFVGDFIALPFWIFFTIYMFVRGFGVINGSKLAVMVIDIIAKAIPGIQEFPEITLGVIIVFVLIRLEDKTGLKLTKPKSLAKQIESGNFQKALSASNPLTKATGRTAQLVQQRQQLANQQNAEEKK